MSLTSAVLQRLDMRLPLDGLEWDTARGDASLPEAAVLVALTDEREPRVVLGRRTQQMKHHPGEIAFPGGKREPGDLTPWATAKREAMEEVGLPAGEVHPLGELQPLVTRTNFEVHPCIARVPDDLEFVVDPREFDSVFTRPLSVFADRKIFRLETYDIDGRKRKAPHYQVGDDDVWGVTAAILAMLANLAYDAGLDLERDWNRKP